MRHQRRQENTRALNSMFDTIGVGNEGELKRGHDMDETNFFLFVYYNLSDMFFALEYSTQFVEVLSPEEEENA